MELKEIEISKLKGNNLNPNEMSDRKFNFLVENIKENGFLEPVGVVDMGNDVYEIFSGHHRAKAGEVLGLEKIPCVVFTKEELPQKKRDLQLMRMNVIKGEISPEKFLSYYETLSTQYGMELAGAMFGLEDNELEKLLKTTRDTLPPEMRDSFDKVKDEIKTIDDLAKVLNRLFTEYGDTVQYNFMFFDFGGKDHLWIRANKDVWSKLQKIAKECEEKKQDINDVMNEILAR